MSESDEIKEIKDQFEIPVQEVSAALESILFVSGESVTTARLCEILGVERKTVEDAMKRLINDYENDPWGGLLIRKIEDSYIMCTKPGRPPLSGASYETLAVIAYNQPVTRAQVEAVRGVSSDSIISRLLDRGWICESGTLDAPGRPTLFSTTEQFLLEFGIESVDELPSMELMSYKTIRDLEMSLEKAAGNDDRQISIDSYMEENKDETDNEGGDSDGEYD